MSLRTSQSCNARAEAIGFEHKDGMSVLITGRFGLVEIRHRQPIRKTKGVKPYTAYLKNPEGIFEATGETAELAVLQVYQQYGRYHAFKDLEANDQEITAVRSCNMPPKGASRSSAQRTGPA